MDGKTVVTHVHHHFTFYGEDDKSSSLNLSHTVDLTLSREISDLVIPAARQQQQMEDDKMHVHKHVFHRACRSRTEVEMTGLTDVDKSLARSASGIQGDAVVHHFYDRVRFRNAEMGAGYEVADLRRMLRQAVRMELR